MPWLGEFLWHCANEVENEFAIQADVIHPQMRNTAFDILFARRKARLEIIDDSFDGSRDPPLRQLVAHTRLCQCRSCRAA